MKLYNKYHKDAPQGAIYIGRPSVFGNPFTISKDGTRDEVIDRYDVWLIEKLKDVSFRAALKQLAQAPGLVCFCSPKRCHGDSLIAAMRQLQYLSDTYEDVGS